MSDPFDPNNASSLLNPEVVNQRFVEIQQEELTASEEARIKQSARDLKANAVKLNDDLNRQLRKHSSEQNWDQVMEVTKNIEAVEQTITTAATFDKAVKSRFSGLPTRSEKLNHSEKKEIFHAYHGSPEVTQDMLASDYRKPQSTINTIVNSDPTKFVKK